MLPGGLAPLGSSPLARGLLNGSGVMKPADRIIPARAGFTRRGTAKRSGPRDHPRSRGVYGGVVEGDDAVAGSSPLARGLRPLHDGADAVAGIIPARAGFTARPTACSRGRTDHPRSRGVYRITASAHGDLSGSSPLARGLRSPSGRRSHDGGIIPARAGFTMVYILKCHNIPDHPRSRGVY